MLGTVLIRNLEFQGKHGASAAERRTARRFQVDVQLTFDVSRAMESDRLGDTINYDEVCALVHEIGTAQPYRLIEALAGEMMRRMLQRWPDVKVALELRKLHPPSPGNPAFTAVQVSSQ